MPSLAELPQKIAGRIQIGPVPQHRPELGPCWLWPVLKKNGYAQIRWEGRMRMLHSTCLELVGRPRPKGLICDHLCRVPACCNPDHLEWVTHGENTRRGINACRERTHCKHGHEYSSENTHVNANGARQCRACWRRRSAECKARKAGGE